MSVATKSKRSPRDHYITPQKLCDYFGAKVAGADGGWCGRWWDVVFDLGAGDGRIGRAVFEQMAERAKFYDIDIKRARCQRVFVDPVPMTDPRSVEQWYAELFTPPLLAQYCKPWNKVLVVSNPPYSEMTSPATLIDPVLFNLETKAAVGSQAWFLLRLDWLGARKRVEFINSNPPAYLKVLVPRPKFMTHLGKDSSDSGEYAWHGWEVGRDGRVDGTKIESWEWDQEISKM